ncbi:MAG: tandem-95 repeat protein [bacterium]
MMIRRLSALLAIGILFGGGMLDAEATTYYVSTSGSNGNPGSYSQPWLTLGYSASSSSGVSAGDTIVVRAGNYPESVYPSVSGTLNNYIVITAYPNETVTLDPGRFRFESNINYWHIDGLSIFRSDQSGVYAPNGTHAEGFLKITNCEISHHKENGICLIGPNFGGFTVEDCVIEYNGEVNGQPSNVEGTGICMYGGTGKIWARRNWIAYNYAKGISHATDTEWHTDGSIIDSNAVVDNYESGIDFWGDNSYIRHNYLFLNGTRDTESQEWGDKGFALDNNAEYNEISYNVFRSSGRHEIDPRGSNNKIYHNTIIKDHYYTAVLGSPYAAAIIIWEGNGIGNEFRNNIIMNLCEEENHQYVVLAGHYTKYTGQIWSNNLYYAPYASGEGTDKQFKLYNAPGTVYYMLDEVQQTWPAQEIGSLYGDPEFDILADTAFALSAGSPAVDGGMVVFPSQFYYGSAPDMGAFEYEGGNTPPWIDPPLYEFITDEDVEFGYDLTPHENDAEQTGAELTWMIFGLDASLASAVIDPVTDLLTITPVLNQSGSDNATLMLVDNQGGQTSTQVTITINPVNDPPYISPAVPDLTGQEDVVFTYSLTGHENDLEQSGSELTWSLSGLDPALATGSVSSATDLLTITPVPGVNGSDQFQLILSDGQGGQDTQQLMFTVSGVNDPPYIDPVVPDFVTVEDSVITFDLSAYEHDPEQGPAQLTWAVTDVDTTLFTVSVELSTDILTIFPATDQNGTDDFYLILSDGAGASVNQRVSLTITPVNDPPWIDPPIMGMVTVEDSIYVIDLSDYENDLEQSGTQLTWTISGLNPTLAVANINTISDVLVITAMPNQFGDDEFTLYLDDGFGVGDSQVVILTIAPVNDVPWIDPNVPNLVTGEDAPIIFDLSPFENDIDNTAEELVWTFSGLDPALGEAVIDPVSDMLTMTPLIGVTGSDEFTLYLTDIGGLVDSQMVIITVSGANSPPYIDPGVPNFTTAEDSVLTFDLSLYEHDPEQAPEQLIWVAINVDATLAEISIDPVTDVMTIDPVLNSYGADLFTLLLSDGVGGLDSQAVILTVTSVNDPPDINPAVPDEEMKEDIVHIVDLTQFETDVEDSAAALYWTVSGVNTNLLSVSIDLLSDELTATSVLNLSGEDTLSLTLHDSDGSTDSQDWILTVVAVNDTPYIAPPIADQLLENYLPFTFSLLNYGHDVEDPAEALNWMVSEVDPTLFSATIDTVTKELLLTPVVGAAGTDEILLTLEDTEGAPTQQYVEVTLFEGGIPPVPPDIAGIPDLWQPLGMDPAPIELEAYVTPGTVPFDSLGWDVDIWDPSGVGQPDISVYVKFDKLYVEAPIDWEGTRLVAVKAIDFYNLFDTDTLEVTYSGMSSGSSIPEISAYENWYIIEPEQRVNTNNFVVHIGNYIEPEGFGSFQAMGGYFLDWLDVSGTDEFLFELVPDEANILQLRIRYTDNQTGAPKGVIITEDSIPPSAPLGLQVRQSTTGSTSTGGGD